jgi:copper chaperone
MASTTLSVGGMSCDGCEEIVEDALEEVAGVESAEADHEEGSATVEGDADIGDLVEAVDFAGYEGAADSEGGEGEADDDEDEEE